MKYILEAILGGQWAITEGALQAIIEIANRSFETPIDPKIFHGSLGKEAILPRGGIQIERTRNATLHGKIAVLPLVGPIFPRANIMTNWSGALDVQGFLNDYKALQDNREVEGIIINGDGPGGYITGIVEASDYIFESRGNKPVVTYVYGMSASATLWISSSTDETIMSPTSEIGSIGVVAAYRSTKERDTKKGIKDIEIVSSNAPNKRLDLESDSGKAVIQKTVDELETIMVERIARNRGTISEDVYANYGQGGMLVAQSAVDIGLADRIGNLTSLIDDMNGARKLSNNILSTLQKGESMDLEKLKAEHPELYKKVFGDGHAVGVEDENARIKAIYSIDYPGSSETVAKLMFDKTATKESISVVILDKQSTLIKDKKSLLDQDGEKTTDKVKGVEDKPDDKGATTKEERTSLVTNLKKGAKVIPY